VSSLQEKIIMNEAREERNEHVHPTEESGKQPWQEPKLTFVEPKLTKHGNLEEVTSAFFGGFTP
jgi:hypothetical protein